MKPLKRKGSTNSDMGHGKYIAPPKGQYQVAAGEVLNLQFTVLPGESRDIDVRIDLTGPGAEAHLKGLYLCRADEKVNFRIVMHHMAPGCKSTQLFNGIAGGHARRVTLPAAVSSKPPYRHPHPAVSSKPPYRRQMVGRHR